MSCISLLITMNLVVCCRACNHEITIHQLGKTICICTKHDIDVSMSLYNLIGNRVHNWGPVKLNKGTNTFDCLNISGSSGIYILRLKVVAICIAKRIVISP